MPPFKLPYACHYKPRLVYFYPISKDHFFVFNEVFSENSVLMYGLHSRAACNQGRLMMARVRYVGSTRLNATHFSKITKAQVICYLIFLFSNSLPLPGASLYWDRLQDGHRPVALCWIGKIITLLFVENLNI